MEASRSPGSSSSAWKGVPTPQISSAARRAQAKASARNVKTTRRGLIGRPVRFISNRAANEARIHSVLSSSGGRLRKLRNGQRAPQISAIDCIAWASLVTVSLVLAFGAQPMSADEAAGHVGVKQQLAADSKAALEAELNAILQQQELGQETNSKLLSEAIISRLMLGNLTDIGPQEENSESFDGPPETTNESSAESSPYSDPDAMRLRRMLNFIQNYELAQGGGGGQSFNQYPVLPAGQAATIKRASLKMTNYLRQQAQHQPGGQRQLTGYGRVNSFDFGLGKRPDSSVSGNVLRFGDSAGAHMATVSGSGLGKRPSAHRYDFGLGKRVASPVYPRYDFGLGKRAPNRVRYDFGLGK